MFNDQDFRHPTLSQWQSVAGASGPQTGSRQKGTPAAKGDIDATVQISDRSRSLATTSGDTGSSSSSQRVTIETRAVLVDDGSADDERTDVVYVPTSVRSIGSAGPDAIRYSHAMGIRLYRDTQLLAVGMADLSRRIA